MESAQQAFCWGSLPKCVELFEGLIGFGVCEIVQVAQWLKERGWDICVQLALVPWKC